MMNKGRSFSWSKITDHVIATYEKLDDNKKLLVSTLALIKGLDEKREGDRHISVRVRHTPEEVEKILGRELNINRYIVINISPEKSDLEVFNFLRGLETSDPRVPVLRNNISK